MYVHMGKAYVACCLLPVADCREFIHTNIRPYSRALPARLRAVPIPYMTTVITRERTQ